MTDEEFDRTCLVKIINYQKTHPVKPTWNNYTSVEDNHEEFRKWNKEHPEDPVPGCW